MKYIVYVLIGFLAAVLVLMAYVRLAPSKAEVWHNPQLPVMGPGQYPAASGYVEQRAVEGDGREVLARLDQIIRATPRTTRLAGSVEAGKVSYVTRSRVFGFPDYTTVTLSEGQVQVFGRLRFGQSDLGVNRARIEGWFAQLDQDRPQP